MTGDERHWLTINRAPVLTLWAAVVAERLGFDRDEALTLGRAVAGLNAYSKGKSLGLFSPTPEDVRKKRKETREREGFSVDLLHRAVPATRTPDGLRALSKDKPIKPESVQKYLESKFGDALEDASDAMHTLARSVAADELARVGFRLYEEFRPEIPSGTKGWGAKGRLDLDQIRSMAS
jgi:hypothetical protein